MPENNGNPVNYKTLYPDSTEPDAEKATKFLVDFAAGGPITVGMIPAEGEGGRGQTFDTSDPKAVAAMKSFIRAYEKQPFQVFWMPNRAVDDYKTPLPAKEHITEIRGLCLDFDPDPNQPTIEDARLALREKLDTMLGFDLGQPFAAIDSGGGMQFVYRLKTPVRMPLDGFDKAVSEYETLVKSLARSFGSDPATHRINNFFRVPFTYNWPNKAKKAKGREKSVSGIWHQGGPTTSLEDLRRLCVIRPEDLVTPTATVVDFDGLVEAELVAVLGKPKQLPERIQTLLRSTPALETALKRPVDPTDMSRHDHSICMSMARLKVPPSDMALILAAYGAKVQRTFKEKRLFSYVAGTVSKALKVVAVEMGFESPAEAEAAQKAHVDAIRLIGVTEATTGIFDDAEIGVVEGLLPAQGMFVIYGESGSGKTFAALDLCYRVSLGLPWCGRRTTQGVVVYVAAESPRSVRRRLKALVDLHGHSDDFLLLPAVVNMFEGGADLTKLKVELDKVGRPIRMIVFDTLARVMLGGNENATQDMSALVANGDRLRDGYRTLVGWVHHSGKDKSLGARGSSALRAATDAEMEVGEGASIRIFDVTKLRDGDLFKCEFDLKSVEIGTMKDGTVVNTCVVDWKGVSAPAASDPGAKLRDQIRIVLEQLAEPSTIKDIVRDGKALSVIKNNVSAESIRRTILRAIDKDSYFKEFDANEKGEKRYGLLSW